MDGIESKMLIIACDSHRKLRADRGDPMSNALSGRAAVLESAIEIPVRTVSGPDPVFAAIAARHATLEELIAAAHAHDALWNTMPPEAKRHPYVVAGGSVAFDHSQIDELIDATINQASERWGDFLDATQLEDMRADRHAKLNAELEVVARIQRELGYTAVKARFDAAHAADTEALRAVCRTAPITLGGVATLAGWINETFEDLASLDNGEPLAEALANLKQAVRAFASGMPRSSRDGALVRKAS